MRALVLNYDYSPVGVCTVERAFLLIYRDKAEQVQAFENFELRTVSRSFSMPAVVRLLRYVNIPYKSVELTRNNIFKRDGFECQYCGSESDLTLDHVIPRSKGGPSNWKNLVTACKTCNAQKGNFSPEQAGLPLKQAPFKPSYVMFLRDFSGFEFDEWRPYLQKAG
jgi:5-methylcytosine-specific restriction endonuclease McrA